MQISLGIYANVFRNLMQVSLNESIAYISKFKSKPLNSEFFEFIANLWKHNARRKCIWIWMLNLLNESIMSLNWGSLRPCLQTRRTLFCVNQYVWHLIFRLFWAWSIEFEFLHWILNVISDCEWKPSKSNLKIKWHFLKYSKSECKCSNT